MNAPTARVAAVGRPPQAPQAASNAGALPSRRDHTTARSVCECGSLLSLFARPSLSSPPTLHITNAGPGFATLWWTPPSGTNWVLQERLSLTTGTWTNSPSGWTSPVVVPATLSTEFCHLFKP